jgi:hypothetical protein
MLKISATQLEAHRRYTEGKMSLEQLHIQLLRLEPPNELMALGTKFHELLQADTVTPKQCEPNFEYNQILEARSNIDYRCKAFEIKLRSTIETWTGEQVVITGVADQLFPGMVVEYKTRYSPFQYEGYAESMQWRLYCLLFDVPAVNYKVWEMKRIDETNFCSVKSYNDFKLYEYPNLKHDVRDAISEFVNLVRFMGISKEPILQYESNELQTMQTI